MPRVYARLVTAIAIGALLSACGFSVSVRTRVDPAYAPVKNDPVFLTTGVHSTIQDRQMLPLIKKEMELEGFNLVGFDQAKWVVIVGRDDRTVITGTTSQTAGVATGLVGVGLLGFSTTHTTADTETYGEIMAMMNSSLFSVTK